MMRRILSILFYIPAVIFFYTSSVIVSMNIDLHEDNGKAIIIAFFIIAGIIFNFVGSFIMGFKNWKTEAGVIFITSASIGGLCIIVLLCMAYDPGVKEIIPEFKMNYFGNFTSAILYTIMMGFFGSFLYQSAK